MENGKKVFDTLIVGGGPGGLAAAYYLARFRRSVRVLDSGESRAAWVPVTHNHAGFPKGIEGPALLERMRRQVLDAGGCIDHTCVEDARQLFVLETGMGPVHGRTLLLATGVVDVKPELPDLVDAVRDGLVRYCPVCDAYEARGKDILVLGSGESGFGEADFLRDFSDRITVLTQGIQVDPGSAAYRRLEDRQVQVIERPLAKLAADTEGGRIRLTLAGGHELDFDLVYSAMGYTPRNDLAKRLHVEIGEDRRIVTDRHQETSVRNCFAAGDVVQGLNQISVAIGQAAVAATTMHNRLREASRLQASREDRAGP